MKMTEATSDTAVLKELGKRLAARRLSRNMKQDELAKEAGIGLRTLQRLESGEAASRLSSFVRVLNVLGLQGNLDMLVPEAAISPMLLLDYDKRLPKRASKKRTPQTEPGTWNWKE
jgi:transcriptional regulator with XRE-family HTH domain